MSDVLDDGRAVWVNVLETSFSITDNSLSLGASFAEAKAP